MLNAGVALFVESNINEIQMAKYASDERLTFTNIRRETGSLYYSQDMESFATGLKRIQHLCDVAGCKVDYRKDAYGFTRKNYCGDKRAG